MPILLNLVSNASIRLLIAVSSPEWSGGGFASIYERIPMAIIWASFSSLGGFPGAPGLPGAPGGPGGPGLPWAMGGRGLIGPGWPGLGRICGIGWRIGLGCGQICPRLCVLQGSHCVLNTLP